MKKKPIFNVCLRVILPIILVITVLVMAATYALFWNSCNDVSPADKSISDSGILTGHILLEAEEEGYYYEVFGVLDSSETVAFRVSTEQRDKIPYMEPSYYPMAFWHGEYEIMDLSQDYLMLDSGYGIGYLSQPDQVKVYDFSAYKGHTQSMGRGLGLALIIFWSAELFVAGTLILLDLMAGVIIFCINRSRQNF